MKLLPKLLLAALLFPSLQVVADNTADGPADQYNSLQTKLINPATDDTPQNELVQYLLNLGGYLGFNLKVDPTTLKPPLVQTLIKILDIEPLYGYLPNSLLGATLVNSLQLPNVFLPEGSTPEAAAINGLANNTFKNPAYNTYDPTRVTANPLIDQPVSVNNNEVFQTDPINQALYNFLATPDVTFCKPGGAANLSHDQLKKCKLTYQSKILKQLIGNLPSYNADFSTEAFFSPLYVQGLLSQLNSNSLMAPLRYTTTPSTTDTSTVDVGIKATSQAAQAANFIRYASGAVVPPVLVSYDKYKTLYEQATSEDERPAAQAIKRTAQNTLNTYFANLRIFAARSSVGLSNLYFILSKRMEQKLPDSAGGDGTVSLSQAQKEYEMATRRLNGSSKWVEQINSASTATVQKEMAVLLAEINYQLYLNRQLEERLLLTQSITQLQSTSPPINNLPVEAPPPTK